MGFKINRVRWVAVEETTAYVGAVRLLPDSVTNSLCCCRPVGQPPREAPAIILIADRGVPIHRQLVIALANLPGPRTGRVFLTDRRSPGRGAPYRDSDAMSVGTALAALGVAQHQPAPIEIDVFPFEPQRLAFPAAVAARSKRSGMALANAPRSRG